jgi:hypothetical protein
LQARDFYPNNKLLPMASFLFLCEGSRFALKKLIIKKIFFLGPSPAYLGGRPVRFEALKKYIIFFLTCVVPPPPPPYTWAYPHGVP